MSDALKEATKDYIIKEKESKKVKSITSIARFG